jgi:hypothetical protein
LEVIITLVLGVPSLAIAFLTWLETRHSHLAARKGTYPNHINSAVEPHHYLHSAMIIEVMYGNDEVFHMLLHRELSPPQRVIAAAHPRPPMQPSRTRQITRASELYTPISPSNFTSPFQTFQLNSSLGMPSQNSTLPVIPRAPKHATSGEDEKTMQASICGSKSFLTLPSYC